MEKNYDHQSCEDQLYKRWEDSGLMRADNATEKKTFSIVLPPPNVTGILHMGHACMLAIEDILVRYKKMTDHEVLWVPGTDHAAIATENVVLRHLGIAQREDLSREDFLKECRHFSQEKHDRIIDQTKKMGSWLDWSREAYTLDEPRSFAVQEIFQRLWKQGLIVRGYRMVNWSVGAQSVLADDEVEHRDISGALYQYRYEIVEDPGTFLEVATTRPETLFGDVALAIHPQDPRAQKLRGKTVKIPFSGRVIPLIEDEYVDRDFGTATLKVTPAHDPNDFEIGKRHHLEPLQVIDFDGKMSKSPNVPQEFQGLSREECRKKLTQKSAFLAGQKTHVHSVGHCYRTGTIIEPMISQQWFIAVNKEFKTPEGETTTLKKMTLDALKEKHIQIIPQRFEKVYYQWIENLRDWCISRQIWWGHRIPVWYDQDGKEHLAEKQTFILARHGQTDANAQKIVQGQDNPLNEKGIAQAQDLAQHLLSSKKITRIISSPSARALQSARIVGEKLNLPVETLEELRAIDFGDIIGKYLEKGVAIEHAQKAQTGEPPQDVLARVKTAWEKLKNYKSSGDILVVGHRSIFSALESIRSGREDLDSLIKNRENNENAHHGIWKEISVFQAPSKENLTQDPDTLDTWFSSALWPFSTLGWPDTKNPDYEKFYPTQLMETGDDILFFWVARMIMFGKYATGKYPFSHIYLHGIVTDEKGQKMSKSKGNGIDPLDMIREFGADAVRLSLVIGTTPGNTMALGTSKIAGYRYFVNKIWNAGRFVKMQTQNEKPSLKTPSPRSLADRWILSRLHETSQKVAQDLEKYQISRAGDRLYHFMWDEFCDWYIEASKCAPHPAFLKYIFGEILKLLHPLCPFVTQKIKEDLWGKEAPLLITQTFPQKFQKDSSSEENFAQVQEIVKEIRKIRAQKKINPQEKIALEIQKTKDPVEKDLLQALGNLSEIQEKEVLSNPLAVVGGRAISLDITLDPKIQEKEKKELENTIASLKKRLGNPHYTEKAPAHLVEETRQKLEEAQEKLAHL